MTTPAIAPPRAPEDRDDPRTLLPLLALFWVGCVASAMAQVYATVRIDGARPALADLLRWVVPGYVVWLIAIPLITFVLSRRFRFHHGQWRLAVPIHGLACLCIAAATLAVDSLALNWRRAEPDFLATMASLADAWLLWLVFTYWFFLAFVLAIRHHSTASARQLHAMRLEAALANARLDALRAQLHPHFLFNALNSVSSLIGDDPRAARQMLARIAELLRTVLATGGDDEWTLRQELDLLQRYAAIERVRFGPRLTLDVSCDAAVLDARVPALLLQPLIENAILHGIQPALHGGTVRIVARRENVWLELEVCDDGIGISPAAGERVGLSNIRERLERRYADRQTLSITRREPAGTRVLIRIPWSPSPAHGEPSHAAGR